MEDTGVSWAPSGRLEPGLRDPNSIVSHLCNPCLFCLCPSQPLQCFSHLAALLQEMLLLIGDSPLTRACELCGSVAAALRVLATSLVYGLLLEGILGLCTCCPHCLKYSFLCLVNAEVLEGLLLGDGESEPERGVGVWKTNREWESVPGKENNLCKGMGVHTLQEGGRRREGLKLERMRHA